ncbi:odorant-binding protein 84a [Cochliomyia hominivorax]
MNHYKFNFLYFVLILIILQSMESLQKAKDNGDIYIVKEEKFIKEIKKQMQTESSLLPDNTLTTTTTFSSTTTENPNLINFDEIISLCNSSFSIPMYYYTTFNKTASLPELVDKTGMCFIRCFYEKSGLLENWKLNAMKIRTNMWPAMGDTIEVCEKEGEKQKNPCVRAYAIAKCLTLRKLADAGSGL